MFPICPFNIQNYLLPNYLLNKQVIRQLQHECEMNVYASMPSYLPLILKKRGKKGVIQILTLASQMNASQFTDQIL